MLIICCSFLTQILGMVPNNMLESTADQQRVHFFEQQQGRWTIKQTSDGAPLPESSAPIVPSSDPIASLKEVVSKEANQAERYDRFVDLIYRMLAYRPSDRITPSQALEHPFITNQDVG